ncbi:LURP-one-related/scramblase family protein [Halomarina rubra]|uniref:LURP-one-related/scramblase family protein n=1 Tax=Halomarina rubra TaxID=2071873 RepID=A0ABD6ATZ3_9EURY|nr:LURP-one-related family protein [Halomarina rubra]
MTQKLVAVGDDYTVETAAGDPAFEVDGKALRVRETLRMIDLRTGDEYKLQEKLARVRDTMTIEKNGERAATVKKALVAPLRDRFTVSIDGMDDLRVQGNVFDHEYELFRDGERVAGVSKAWFRYRDTYGIEVATGMDAGLVVACAVVLDMMVQPER